MIYLRLVAPKPQTLFSSPCGISSMAHGQCIFYFFLFWSPGHRFMRCLQMYNPYILLLIGIFVIVQCAPMMQRESSKTFEFLDLFCLNNSTLSVLYFICLILSYEIYLDRVISTSLYCDKQCLLVSVSIVVFREGHFKHTPEYQQNT